MRHAPIYTEAQCVDDRAHKIETAWLPVSWSMHEAVAMVDVTARAFFGAVLELLKRFGSQPEDGVSGVL